MPTRDEVLEQSPPTGVARLSDVEQRMLVIYARTATFWQPGLFPDWPQRLANASDTDAEILLTLLVKLEEQVDDVGDSTVMLQGGRYALDYNTQRDRDYIIRLALALYYDVSSITVSQGVSMGTIQYVGILAQRYGLDCGYCC